MTSPRALARRLAAERSIARRIVRDALNQGCTVSVHDGGEWVVTKSATYKTIFAALFSTDSDTLSIRRAGERIGTVYLVYGNDGFDVISDYTDTEAMAVVLKGAHELAARIEQRIG